ncbi:hypothetical protein EB118_07155, partial [bacterium]|nr:hypothetical protein [bacterium]
VYGANGKQKFPAGGGSAAWGSIGAGTGVGSQTDLVTYLNTNYYPLASNPAGYLTASSLIPYLTIASAAATYTPLTRNLTINGVTYDLSADRSWTIAAGVTSVTATAPLTSSGGATPDISTSMNTNKLIGRTTAGVGVMEEITLNTGLSFSGSNLNVGNIDLSVLAVSSTNAREDNWTPAGWPGTTSNRIKVIEFTPNYVNKLLIVSGLTNGSAGRIVTIRNMSTDNLVILENNSTSSSSGNIFKFYGRGGYFLFPGEDVTLIYNGTNWSQLNGNLNNGHGSFDDFLSPNHAAGTTFAIPTIGYANASGTGALCRNENYITGQNGSLGLTSGTTSTGYVQIKNNARGGINFQTTTGTTSKICVVARCQITTAIPTVAENYIFQVGVSLASNAVGGNLATSLCWYIQNTVTSTTNWITRAQNAAGTVTTETASGLPITVGQPVVVGCWYPNTNGDCVYFYSADGGVTYTVDNMFVRVTSTYGGNPVFVLQKTAGTTSRIVDIDYIGITIKGGVV